VFNILGPLANPAGAPHQVLGVFDETLMESMAEVLLRLGAERALLVHGRDGLDEVSLCAPTRILVVADRAIQEEIFDPRSLGFSFCAPERLAGGDALENAGILRAILEGEQGPRRDVVVLNAAAALRAAGRVEDFAAGVDLARRSLDEGRAREVLRRYVDFTHRAGEAT
jgi:anthranilate phosphoribosyltransferase